jgi:hypothetical protein
MTLIPKRPHRTHAAVSILVGLATAQAIALFFVRQSNQALLRSTQAADAAGWLAIPAGSAALALDTFGYAFRGALFFTLSTGALLTLATWAVTCLLGCLGRVWRRRLIAPVAACWIALLGYVNFRGPVGFATLLVIGVPLCTLCTRRRAVEAAHERRPMARIIVPAGVLLLLIGAWASQADRDLFTTIRDQLLLSNAIGRHVNDFYYRYTLGPAELLKSFNQKTVRTCRLENFVDPMERQSVATRLAAADVLTVDAATVDARIVRGDDRVRLILHDQRPVETDLTRFLGEPAAWVRQSADLADRRGPLRRITFIGVLIAFPILLYAGVYALAHGVAATVLAEPRATFVAGIFCLALGGALLLPMLQSPKSDLNPAHVNDALNAARWQTRVAALKQIERQGLEIARYPNYRALLRSPRVVERYWLARALAVGHDTGGEAELLTLLDDPHPNVACQAYYALGRRGRPEHIDIIRDKMLRSDHWYTQWYGYRAMKELRWRQTRSD